MGVLLLDRVMPCPGTACRAGVLSR